MGKGQAGVKSGGVDMGFVTKSERRKPKPEGRPKAEGRNPNIQGGVVFPLLLWKRGLGRGGPSALVPGVTPRRRLAHAGSGSRRRRHLRRTPSLHPAEVRECSGRRRQTGRATV